MGLLPDLRPDRRLGVLPCWSSAASSQGFSAGGESVGAPVVCVRARPRQEPRVLAQHHHRRHRAALRRCRLDDPHPSASPCRTKPSWRGAGACRSCWHCRWPSSASGSAAAPWKATRSTRPKLPRHKEFSPVREAFRENRLRMVQVIFVMGLTAMGFYFLSAYFVSYVQTTGHLSREQSLLANAAALALYAVLLPIGGRLSDRFGRKPMLIAGSAALALLSVPSFMLVTSGSLPLALLGQALFVVALCIYGGGCYTFFVEIFTTRTRFTSAAISYNGAYALFGGTAPFIGTALVGGTGAAHAARLLHGGRCPRRAPPGAVHQGSRDARAYGLSPRLFPATATHKGLPMNSAAFLQDFHHVATIGATSNNGVDRQAATAEDAQTRDWFAGWVRDAGWELPGGRNRQHVRAAGVDAGGAVRAHRLASGQPAARRAFRRSVRCRRRRCTPPGGLTPRSRGRRGASVQPGGRELVQRGRRPLRRRASWAARSSPDCMPRERMLDVADLQGIDGRARRWTASAYLGTIRREPDGRQLRGDPHRAGPDP